MSHRNAGPVFLWRESTHFVQSTWTQPGTDDFLELKSSEELEGFAAL